VVKLLTGNDIETFIHGLKIKYPYAAYSIDYCGDAVGEYCHGEVFRTGSDPIKGADRAVAYPCNGTEYKEYPFLP
jgi:hypothetical protein